MSNEQISAAVTQMRTMKDEYSVTLQQIVEQTERDGSPISLSTIRRVFDSDGGTDFRISTLKPIAAALSRLTGEEIKIAPAPKAAPVQADPHADELHMMEERVQSLREKERIYQQQIEYHIKNEKRARIVAYVLGGVDLILLLVDILNPAIGIFFH